MWIYHPIGALSWNLPPIAWCRSEHLWKTSIGAAQTRLFRVMNTSDAAILLESLLSVILFFS